MAYKSANLTQSRTRLVFLARILREEADNHKADPKVRNKLIEDARKLTWTFRTLSATNPNVVNQDVVDSMIDAAIEIVVCASSCRINWLVRS